MWKDIGMELKDAAGPYVQIDHPRFQPIWDFLAEQHIPVLAHIAEPLAAWQPLERREPALLVLHEQPAYHAYQHPEIPRHEEIIAARDRWVARNPRLTDRRDAPRAASSTTCARWRSGSTPIPNLYVETAARINDLAMQPSDAVREFMIQLSGPRDVGHRLRRGIGQPRGAGRVVHQHWRYYAGADTVTLGSARGWHRTVQGLALPREVLEQFAHRNAERVLSLPAAR